MNSDECLFVDMSEKFLKNLDNKKHILLVYDNEEHAQIVQFEFLQIGLRNNESCIYLAESKDKIKKTRNSMKKFGIDVKYYEDLNRLKIYQIPEIERDPDGIWACFKKFSEKILTESSGPYRIVGRIIHDISTDVGMSVQLVIEKNVHAIFDRLNASIMCHYDATNLSEESRSTMIETLCSSHHLIINIKESNISARDL
jgi:hypothetical protein